MRVVLLVLIVLWPAIAQARWIGTAEQWADLQSRDAYGDMGIWFNSLSSKTAGSCCSARLRRVSFNPRLILQPSTFPAPSP